MSKSSSLLKILATLFYLSICTWPNHSLGQKPEREMMFKEEKLSSQLSTDASLVSNLRDRLRSIIRRQVEAAGDVQVDEEAASVPPGHMKGMPSTGNLRVPVLMIDFPDYPRTSAATVEWMNNLFFGEGGDTYKFPFDSLRKFYLNSSFNQLNIQGDVYGWYTASHPRSYYQSISYTEHELALEAMTYYNNLGADFSQYDSDNNGYIDAVFIEWTGPDGSSPWIPRAVSRDKSQYAVDGKRIYGISFCSAVEDDTTSKWVYAEIHEAAHLMGIPDYYDYDDSIGPRGGLGGTDVMAAGSADHNAFTKFLLGWTTPQLVTTNQSKFLTLKPRGVAGESVLIMPGSSLSNVFSEFFLVEYMKVGANNDYVPPYYSNPQLGDGLMIWHVDAQLDDAGLDFRYDNSYTAHKLLRLMEADGQEHVEAGGLADVNDYWNAPSEFGPSTLPSSNSYTAVNTGVWIDYISKGTNDILARYSVGARTAPTPLATAIPTATPIGDPSPDPNKISTMTNARLSTRSVKIRKPFVVSGTIKQDNGATLPSKTLSIQKSSNKHVWKRLGRVTSGSLGKFSKRLNSTTAGTYYFRVVFGGDSTFNFSSSQIRSLKVLR